jgi:hypothetical protein
MAYYQHIFRANALVGEEPVEFMYGSAPVRAGSRRGYRGKK